MRDDTNRHDPTDAKASAVTFDFGQTLADLDTSMLARRLRERGFAVDATALEARVGAAWAAYNAAVMAGLGGHPWKILMSALLEGAELAATDRTALVDWLWDEQPRANLWRRPIPDMIALARQLHDAGVPIAVLSNSEGRLRELLEELGWSELFRVVADSGKLGIEKPDPKIFEWTARALDVPLEAIVHIGDSFAADVNGALAAGAKAIWFRGDRSRPLPAGARHASDAGEVRFALRAFGLGVPD